MQHFAFITTAWGGALSFNSILFNSHWYHSNQACANHPWGNFLLAFCKPCARPACLQDMSDLFLKQCFTSGHLVWLGCKKTVPTLFEYFLGKLWCFWLSSTAMFKASSFIYALSPSWLESWKSDLATDWSLLHPQYTFSPQQEAKGVKSRMMLNKCLGDRRMKTLNSSPGQK